LKWMMTRRSNSTRKKKVIWWFEDVKVEDCKGGLLGKLGKEGFKPRIDGGSYRSFTASPILEVIGEEADKSRGETEPKKSCCGK